MKIDLDDITAFLVAEDIATRVVSLVCTQRANLIGERPSADAIEYCRHHLAAVRKTVRSIESHWDRRTFLHFVRSHLSRKRTHIRGRDFVAAVAAAGNLGPHYSPRS